MTTDSETAPAAPSLGFLGFGEAAFHMAAGLNGAGLDPIHAYDPVFVEIGDGARRAAAETRVTESGVVAVDSVADLAAAAETIVVAVPATIAKAAIGCVLSHLRAGAHIVDVCSSSPSLKENLAKDCEKRGVIYTDSPMLGPLPVYGHKVPIMASGIGARAWRDAMTPFGMSIRVVSGGAGRASRIKLARSVFTKGFEALLVETFMFARKNGVEDVLMESLEATMDKVSFRQSATRYLAGDLVHAARREHELADAVELMRDLGVEPMVSSGALSRLGESVKMNAAEKLGGVMPETLEEVYRVWEEAGCI